MVYRLSLQKNKHLLPPTSWNKLENPTQVQIWWLLFDSVVCFLIVAMEYLIATTKCSLTQQAHCVWRVVHAPLAHGEAGRQFAGSCSYNICTSKPSKFSTAFCEYWFMYISIFFIFCILAYYALRLLHFVSCWISQRTMPSSLWHRDWWQHIKTLFKMIFSDQALHMVYYFISHT